MNEPIGAKDARIVDLRPEGVQASDHYPADAWAIEAPEGEPLPRTFARTTLTPSVQAGVTLLSWGRISDAPGANNMNALIRELADQATAVNNGKLNRMEAMLVAQAHVLDAVFNDLARRARPHMHERPDAFERYLRLAMKAQSQCRTTIEALAEIKNPRAVAFVKQANIANGHQQVNNTRTRKVRRSQNKLLGGADGKRLERGAKGAGGGAHPALATVVAIDRPKDERRQGAREPECYEARGVQP